MKKINKKLYAILITAVILIISAVLLIPTIQNMKLGLDLQGGFEVLYKVSTLDKSKLTDEMMSSTYKTISKRIDVLGVQEPTIIVEGKDKIRVQLAGVTDASEARNVLSETASLSFRDTSDNLLMTSSVLTSGGAKSSKSETNKPVVSLSVKDKNKFYQETKKVSQSSDNRIVIWLDYDANQDSFSKEGNKCGSLSDSKCLSVASVSQGFSSDVIIQGDFEQDEVDSLVELINSGSLPTKLTEISSKSVKASFGADSLSKTVLAGVVGIVLIILAMTIIYRTAGFLASVGIVVYSAIVLFVFWLVGGTLTLPGIAAVIIGIGMAIDSCVICFERVKDELYNGASLKQAFKNGNKNSFVTVLDANMTTLLVAIILFIFGESSVKGFATMLIISIFATMIVMVWFTRWLINKYVQSGMFNDHLRAFIGINPKDVPNTDKNEKRTKYHFKNLDLIGKRKIFFVFAIIFLLAGSFFLIKDGFNLGIDFRGGTSITVKSAQKLSEKSVKKDMQKLGYNMYSYEKLSDGSTTIKISETLNKKQSTQTEKLFKNEYKASTDIGVVSNLVKKEMVKNAIIALVLATLGILAYVSIRFTFNYALGSIIALLHDVVITCAIFSIFRLEVSSIFIAAILSIIGYSINDTIIIFDRIRENLKKHGTIKSVSELVEVTRTSFNEVLLRSIITISMTLLPVISLIFLGSHEILNFNLALFIGFIAGALSSLFIASQLWLVLEKRHIGKPMKKKWYEQELNEKEELTVKGVNS